MRKDFFGGLLSVYDWEWLWGRTIAQLELRNIDQPIVVYKADKNKEVPWKDNKVDGDYADRQLRKWEEKKRAREKKGKKVNFMKYLQQESEKGKAE